MRWFYAIYWHFQGSITPKNNSIGRVRIWLSGWSHYSMGYVIWVLKSAFKIVSSSKTIIILCILIYRQYSVLGKSFEQNKHLLWWETHHVRHACATEAWSWSLSRLKSAGSAAEHAVCLLSARLLCWHPPGPLASSFQLLLLQSTPTSFLFSFSVW